MFEPQLHRLRLRQIILAWTSGGLFGGKRLAVCWGIFVVVFSLGGYSAEYLIGGDFVVNSEPHNGARPSVRFCVGPSLLAVFIVLSYEPRKKFNFLGVFK
jgi:hypothetical protein